MRNNRRSFILVLTLTMALILSLTATVSAESNSREGSCTFRENGKEITSDFNSADVAKAIENLQPGDDITFTVTYTNAYPGDTDWYMENSVIQTLEKASNPKTVAGTGDAENGGYSYELVNIDSNGEKHVLFSSEEVGGDEVVENMEGLEQATNATEDWFYIDTLAPGDSGKVVLHVAFEGETEVNDYMDTDGEINIRFAVEIRETETVPGPPGKKVKTGDYSNLILWAVIGLVAALLMCVLAFLSFKRDRREAYEDGRGRRSGRTGGDA